ncbi:unnamed protein product [Peniophora sp. CBMAI 1063]|nr:unnamed protein product [Peniophora sp. CBMAI 1063]
MEAHGPGWTSAAGSLTPEVVRDACQRAVDQAGEDNGPYKVRLALAPDGTLDASATRVPPLASPSDPFRIAALSPLSNDFATYQHPPLTLHLTPPSDPTVPSLYTRTKTTHRTPYDIARARAGVTLGAPTDVLLFDEQDRLMEASIRNVALWRDNRWLTPADEVGCLPGVARRWLLKHGCIEEDAQAVLKRDTLRDGEIVLTFNGVEGCRYGHIKKGSPIAM